MSKKISILAKDALLNQENTRLSQNTEVFYNPTERCFELALFGYPIARNKNGELSFNLAGNISNTTRDRLNAFDAMQLYIRTDRVYRKGVEVSLIKWFTLEELDEAANALKQAE